MDGKYDFAIYQRKESNYSFLAGGSSRFLWHLEVIQFGGGGAFLKKRIQKYIAFANFTKIDEQGNTPLRASEEAHANKET